MIFTREQRVGFFFLGGILLFVAFIEATVGTGLFGNDYRLWAEFRDVQGLAKGAAVRVAGVKAGTVEAIELAAERVRVGLSIDEDVVVREDAVARLDFQALSGQRFVAIDLGSPDAKRLEDEGTLRTEEPAGISQMVTELQGVAVSIRELADSLNENQDRLLGTLSTLIEENHQSVNATLENVAGVAEKLNRGEGTLGKLLADATLYDEAVAALADLRESFGDIREVTGALTSGNGTIARLLHDETMYDELRDTVASLGATARSAEDITEQIRAGQGTLGRLLYEDGLYLEAEDAVRGLNRATQGIEDQAPISVLGTFIGTLF